MSVSSRIMELRERRGLNQKELAENLKINRSVLNRIENGTRPVRDDELKIFADYFDVSADYLLGLSDNPAPTDKRLVEAITSCHEILNDVLSNRAGKK